MTDSTAISPGEIPGPIASRRYAVARKRTTALLKGLALVLSEHNCPIEYIASFKKQVHNYLDVFVSEGLWVEHAKSLLAHPFSEYLRNEPPAVPTAGYFRPQGRFKRWCKVRLIAFNRKNTHLWYSWLQCKRCCLPASEDQIEATYLKHRTILTKEDDGDDTVIERIMSNPVFKEHLDEVRAGIIRHYIWRDQPEEAFRPSLRSSLTHTRADGGALGCLKERMGLFQRSSLGFLLEPSQLSGMRYERRLVIYKNNVVTKLNVRELRSFDESLDSDWVESVDANSVYRHHFYDPTYLECKITGIIEPLKVRVISRGPAREYYLCKKLQLAMHGTMRQMPAYRLIGRPLLGGDTMDLRRPEGTEWFSIDYSAATDNLSYKYSGKIFDYIIKDLPNYVQSLAKKVLGMHYMHYPDGTSVLMRRGQLMGSILSFPILCLANMGVYLDVTNEYQAAWNAADRTSSVLINGDDQLYAAPKSLWSRHAAVSGAIGLELSVGKAYVHPTYLNINSTSIHHRYGETPWQIDYLNTGLFFGQSKVMKILDDRSDNVSDTTTNLNRLLTGSLPGRGHILLSKWLRLIGPSNLDKENQRFYYRNSFAGERGYVVGEKRKRRHTFVKDLFLPVELGGCGVVKPLGFVTKRWKKIQKRVATGCYNSIVNPSPRPLPTNEYLPIEDHHVPHYGLISCDSPTRMIYPYSTVRRSFDSALCYRACHLPKRGSSFVPSVLPPVLEYICT